MLFTVGGSIKLVLLFISIAYPIITLAKKTSNVLGDTG
jgi:hypothetical protein